MASSSLATFVVPTSQCRSAHHLRRPPPSRAGRACCLAREPPACVRDAPLLLQAAVRLPESVPALDRSTASRRPSRVLPVADETSRPEFADISLAEVVAARDAWAAAVSRRDLDAVCALYDPRGSRLLGTLDVESTGIRASASSIRSYFRGFLLERHRSITPVFCDGGEGQGVLRLSPGVAAYSGYYSFSLVPITGLPCVAHAKFTFVFRRATHGPGLLIALHNSGLTPAGIL